MTTGYWLLDNPNHAAPRGAWGFPDELREPRGIVLHTAENRPDWTLPDRGAENVAHYFTQTRRPASAHVVIDSDSTVPLLPDWWAAAHVRGHNADTLGVEMATTHTWWRRNPRFDAAVLRRTVAWCAMKAAVWNIPAVKRSPLAWSQGASGFLYHSDLDPTRRRDPGPRFPETLFFDELARRTTVTWQKPGDPIRTEGDAVTCLEYQGDIPPATIPAPDLLMAHAHTMNRLMQLDTRLRDHARHGDTGGAMTDEDIAAAIIRELS